MVFIVGRPATAVVHGEAGLHLGGPSQRSTVGILDIWYELCDLLAVEAITQAPREPNLRSFA